MKTADTRLAGRIKVGPRHRKDLGSIDDLVASIEAVGLIHPIVVDTDGNLIAGERRLAACQRLGWKEIPVTVVDLDDDQRLRVEHDENAVRKDFTPTEAVAIRNARLAREKEKAKERMVAAHASCGNFPQLAGNAREKEKAKERQADLNHPDACGNFPQADTGKSRDKAASGTGYSGRTIDKAAAVMEAAAADPSLAPIVEQMDKTGKVEPAYQEVRARRPRERGEKTPRQLAQAQWEKLFSTFDALGNVLNTTDFSGFVMSTADAVAYRRFRAGLAKFHKQLGSPR